MVDTQTGTKEHKRQQKKNDNIRHSQGVKIIRKHRNIGASATRLVRLADYGTNESTFMKIVWFKTNIKLLATACFQHC